MCSSVYYPGSIGYEFNSKYQQIYIQSFNELGYIDVGDGCWRRFMLVSTLLVMKNLVINLRCLVNINGIQLLTLKVSKAYRCHPHHCSLQNSNKVPLEPFQRKVRPISYPFDRFWPDFINDLGHFRPPSIQYTVVIQYGYVCPYFKWESVFCSNIAYKNSYLALNWAWVL